MRREAPVGGEAAVGGKAAVGGEAAVKEEAAVGERQLWGACSWEVLLLRHPVSTW